MFYPFLFKYEKGRMNLKNVAIISVIPTEVSSIHNTPGGINHQVNRTGGQIIAFIMLKYFHGMANCYHITLMQELGEKE